MKRGGAVLVLVQVGASGGKVATLGSTAKLCRPWSGFTLLVKAGEMQANHMVLWTATNFLLVWGASFEGFDLYLTPKPCRAV